MRTSDCSIEHKDMAWKKREVGLLLLGSFSNDIIVYETDVPSAFSVGSMLENIIQDVEKNQRKSSLTSAL